MDRNTFLSWSMAKLEDNALGSVHASDCLSMLFKLALKFGATDVDAHYQFKEWQSWKIMHLVVSIHQTVCSCSSSWTSSLEPEARSSFLPDVILLKDRGYLATDFMRKRDNTKLGPCPSQGAQESIVLNCHRCGFITYPRVRKALLCHRFLIILN